MVLPVSVIIPTRGTKASLSHATASAWANDPLEVIVIVDGDADVQVDRCVLTRIPNSGGRPGLVRNQGLQMAQGDFVAFLDDDDTWLPGKLQSQLAAMNRDQTPFSCTGPGELSAIFTRAALNQQNPIVCSSVVIETKFLRDHNLYFGDERYAQDFALWRRCLDVCHRGSFVPTPYVTLNANPTDLDRSSIRYAARQSINILIDRYADDDDPNQRTDIANLVSDFAGATS